MQLVLWGFGHLCHYTQLYTTAALLLTVSHLGTHISFTGKSIHHERALPCSIALGSILTILGMLDRQLQKILSCVSASSQTHQQSDQPRLLVAVTPTTKQHRTACHPKSMAMT